MRDRARACQAYITPHEFAYMARKVPISVLLSRSCVAIGAVQNRTVFDLLRAPGVDALRGDGDLSPVRSSSVPAGLGCNAMQCAIR